MIYCQRNLIFHIRQKKNHCIHYLTGQNQGLSGQKNIWLVIMTGDLLSVIWSPALQLTCFAMGKQTLKNEGHFIQIGYLPTPTNLWSFSR